MGEVLKPIQMAVERDQSGGVKVQLGGSMAVMSPDQAFEFAMVVLRLIGVQTNIGENVQAPRHRHFRAG